MAIFIASDLLLFFYLSPLYTLCLNMFLFPVCAAFCSLSGTFLFTFPSPALSPPPIPVLLSPCGPSSAGSPGPCPAPLVHILLPAWLPSSLLPGLLQALLVLPPLLFSSSGSLFMYPWAQSGIAHATAGRRTGLVHGHIIDRSSAKFLGRFVFKAVNGLH